MFFAIRRQIRLVDHDVGRVPAGELRLIVGAAALLVGDAIGDDGRAIGRKCIHPRSDDRRSHDCRCCDRRGRRRPRCDSSNLRRRNSCSCSYV